MSDERQDGSGDQHDRSDVDGAFRRLLDAEGIALGPQEAPIEPDAVTRGVTDSSDSADDEPVDPDAAAAARRRARRMHPSAGLPRKPRPQDPPADPWDREALDAEDPFLEDFRPPDPKLPPARRGMWAAWGFLIGGVVLVLVVATLGLHRMLGTLGGIAAMGALIWLLLRTPRTRRNRGDGAQV